MSGKLKLKFEPKTIEHLGVRMYSTLPPALSELISNAYDADAPHVTVILHQDARHPTSIQVKDDGSGMSLSDIQDKFLAIGRNRREDEGDVPSKIYHRLPTGKKGLGKLALFGLAQNIKVESVSDGHVNEFHLDWEELITAKGDYFPPLVRENAPSDEANGTTITLSKLKRKTAFNIEQIADSLSRIFIFDDTFQVTLVLMENNGSEPKRIILDNKRRYEQVDEEFFWEASNLEIPIFEFSEGIKFRFITSQKPLKPSTNLRGFTIFSRGKLVNAPEFFSENTSSHVYQYLTGWIEADFIDELEEDVISTNRQSLNWEHPKMQEFRDWLQDLVSQVARDWRKKRKESRIKIHEDALSAHDTDTTKWLSTMPTEMRGPMESILEELSKAGEKDFQSEKVLKDLYEILPEYPLLHWRHLHLEIKDRVKEYYHNEQYFHAADQGVKIYAENVRRVAGVDLDGTKLANVFSFNLENKPPKCPDIRIADIHTETGKSIQEGQGHLTRGLMASFRNPANHNPSDVVVPNTFSELDCLNILGLVTYLLNRFDKAQLKGR